MALRTYQLALSAGSLIEPTYIPANRIAFASHFVLPKGHRESIAGSIRRLGGTPNSFEANDSLNRLRTFRLSRVVSGTASAEFFVLLGPGTKVGG